MRKQLSQESSVFQHSSMNLSKKSSGPFGKPLNKEEDSDIKNKSVKIIKLKPVKTHKYNPDQRQENVNPFSKMLSKVNKSQDPSVLINDPEDRTETERDLIDEEFESLHEEEQAQNLEIPKDNSTYSHSKSTVKKEKNSLQKQ